MEDSAAAVAAERQAVPDRHSNPPLRRSDPALARCQARRLLGASGGVDLAALRYALAVQEAIDAAEAVQAAMHDERGPTATQLLADAQRAATPLLQAAIEMRARAAEAAASPGRSAERADARRQGTQPPWRRLSAGAQGASAATGSRSCSSCTGFGLRVRVRVRLRVRGSGSGQGWG